MAKFISIPVTDRGNMIVSADNVQLVEQKSTTSVRISYAGGTQIDITHEASAAGSEEMRDKIQDKIQEVNQKVWQTTSIQIDDLPQSVTDVGGITLIT